MAVGGFTSDWRHGTQGALTTLTDFTAKTRSVTINNSQESVDATVFGDSFKDYESSFKDATIEVTYKSDSTLFGQIAALYSNGSTFSWRLAPAGTSSGNTRITGSGFITSFSSPLTIGSLQELTVSIQVTGAVTFDTF